MSLSFEPLLAPTAWVTLAILSGVLWVWYIWRRPQSCNAARWMLISFLTALAISSVLVVLLNPIWLEALPPPPGKPLLTILIDSSKSMSTKDVGGGETRWQQSQKAVIETSKKLSSTFDVRVRAFTDEVRPIALEELNDTEADGQSSDLSKPVLDALVSERPQGQAILLISDGVHNASGGIDLVTEAASMARSWDAPIYTSIVGGQTSIKDLEIQVPRSQELVFVGQSVPITVEVNQHGRVGNQVTVLLETDGKEIGRQELKIQADEVTPVSFLITPEEVGLYQYQAKVLSLPNEATSSNNSATFQVRVVDEPVQALVLEGKPYWDNKFLLRMLTRDPALEVDCLVRVTESRSMWRQLDLQENNTESLDRKNSSETSSKPSTKTFERIESTELITHSFEILQDLQKLKDYKILLLGREAESFLNGQAIANIRAWLSEDGGSLICYRGAPVAEPDREFSRILPLKWGRGSNQNEERFRVEVTKRGDDLSWLRLGGGEELSKLPSLATTSSTESIKPLAVVLGRGGEESTTPVLTYQPYGTGKVVVIEGAGMWRWAFLSPEYQEHDPVYGTVWQSLLRWVLSSGGLMPGEKVSLQMDRVTFSEGDAISAVVLKKEESDGIPLPQVEMRDEQGTLLQTVQPIPVGSEPGVYQVFLGKPDRGRYEISISGNPEDLPGTRKVSFDVRPEMREQLDIAARPDLMSRISELSDGEVIPIDKLKDLSTKFEQHLQETRPEQYRRVSAWDRWWVLCGILLLWSCTWALRRSGGLI